ncbi:hypothetical protein BZG35_08195 [Brevundimonas sp. LM2]|nr:hypothetical protein BZG35_08195 [Brevundimonas sp. LM2]
MTKRTVDAARPKAKDQFLWDSEVVGLGLKISAGGLKSYVLQYRFEGRARRYSIGTHGSPWTVDMARDRARALQGRLVDSVDPQTEKAGRREDVTVADLCDLYLTEGMATRKESSIASARSDITNHIKPLIGTLKARSVTSQDVDRLLLDIAAGKTARLAKTAKKRGVSRVRGGKGAANASVTILSAAFNFAIRRQIRVDNPALRVRRFPEKKLERFLSPAELARLGEALAAAEAIGVESPYALAAVRLLILTGCRRTEILSLQRAWIDHHHRCLRLPDSKTGAKIVHLGDAALQVIDAVPEVAGNPHLLPGRNGVGHLADIQSSWERIRSAAGLSDVRLHDLRHSFASMGALTGDSLLVIGALLGHRSAKTTQRYAHLSDHPLKDAAERISAEMARLMGQALVPRAQTRLEATTAPAPPGAQGLLGTAAQLRWLDVKAAAGHLGLAVSTLHTYRWAGTGPACRKIGQKIVYALPDLDAWAQARRAVTTSTLRFAA